MVETIVYETEVLAIIVRNTFQKDGIEFFTPNSFSQQLAYMKRAAGHLILPHIHHQVIREVNLTSEVLFIKSGSLRVDFFNDDQKYLESTILKTGDTILFARGGHGLVMLEETEIIEVKQGPYTVEKDKTRFNPVKESLLKFKGQGKK